MKVYYYFCNGCGGDTALYDATSVCPYCHAHQPAFRLVGELTSPADHKDVLNVIAEFRAKWSAKNEGRTVGQAPRRRNSWLRRRAR